MPKNYPQEPPPLPPTCGACVRSDHDACHLVAFNSADQFEPCSCPCGAGTAGAWVE